MRKTIFTFFLALATSVGSIFAESGTCGENLTWDLTDGVLTISGSGDMTDFEIGKSPSPWSYRSSIKSVTIGNSVTSIGERAFSNCSGLTSVTIPNSVTSIGDYAFSGCSGLTSVTIPNSVTSIGEYAFSSCISLTSIIIPNSVTSIGDGAFSRVPNIVYSGDATGSPWGAKSVNGYVDGFLVYSDNAKTNLLVCSAAATGEISIPSSVTSIGDYAFSGCSGLTSVTIPNSVTSIGDWAFGGCTGLTSVEIPNSVTSIGEYAFSSCISLTSIEIPNSVTSIGDHAFSKSGLISFEIPNSVTSIGEGTFCKSYLMSITIPNSVTSIGYYAFAECPNLKSIKIPNSVTSIGKNAFDEDLTTITCEAVTPPTCSEGAFEYVNKSIPVYVPASSVEAYKEADEWKYFGDNIQPIQAAEADVTEIEAEPMDDSVVIEWPTVTGATEYIIQIWKGAELICTLSFNEQGQLLTISYEKKAGNGASKTATQTAAGWQYTIAGLDAGTEYTYTVVAKNGEEELFNETKQFTTTMTTAIEEFPTINCQFSTKIVRDGQLFILRDGEIYNAQGAKVE